MRKYLYIKDIDKDICKNLFDYNKYGSNPKLSVLSDFIMPNRLQQFFRTGRVFDSVSKNTNCSFYIDISDVDLSAIDREFLVDIRKSHIAIDKRFKKSNYHKIDLLRFIPINGFKKAIYCCIKFAKKYPNTKIKLISKHNSDMYLVFEYCTSDAKDEMKLEIVANFLNKAKDVNIVKKINNATFANPTIFIYKHGIDDIYEFEKEVLFCYEAINK